MSRVVVIGSCITRDLWPILGEDVAELLYVARTSLPSLFSAPIGALAVADPPPPPLKRHQHNAMVADLTKTALAALVAHRPTHIIFDFIDERFDLLEVDGALVTHSWELEVSGYLDQPALQSRRALDRLSPGTEVLWRDALTELAGFIAATPLREARLILHEAQWADLYRADNGRAARFPPDLELMTGKVVSRAAHNALLTRYQAAFLAQLPQAARVAAPARLRRGDTAHRWGLSPFHYVDDYYREIWRQLRALGI